MTPVLLIGAGKIGEMIATMLAESGDYQVTVADRDEDALGRLMNHLPADMPVVPRTLDVENDAALSGALSGQYAVLSATPYHLNRSIAPAAKKAGVHYLDLTEDVRSTRLVKDLAADGGTAFIPQCGLAPGFISIVAHDLTKHFDTLHNVHMRVGALPVYPSNALKYNLTWSTDGLINEYCNPCEAIVDGSLREVPPLEEIEHFSLDGMEYEAFNTSGGLGTLCETLDGRVQNLNYRTVRYPGHRDIVKLLLQDLRLAERRDVLKDIFEHALPMTLQDVVLIFVTVSGYREGRFMQETFAHKVYAREVVGRRYSAIQITTASGICAMLDMLHEGQLPAGGFVRQEDAGLKAFLENRFGAAYGVAADGTATGGAPSDAHGGQPHGRDTQEGFPWRKAPQRQTG
ncbi:saccharopine dehydrogenase family protein [Eilatimonas milleporae]|uniref:Saccharopine dehydrogenase-like NADP-dependent oxidoreductase n=1 Tax=Eilatimonas milleporae TaxID=911205 RepID=A0A3M0CVW5_9PROT|nr:saccharopine dehydrogenase family protein [Eilatimonas milleporae]RMB07813.1 saccharopine dehydrogenase-like NADP-dependent oxidoreductase [Eilatimonas milleporae]